MEYVELYEWLDKIPLSRPKVHIARDFADGVMAAEVVSHFLPKMIDRHNYVAANAKDKKKYNWKTLNQKVLRRLGMGLDDDTIEELIMFSPGAVERVLEQLRGKIEEKIRPKKPEIIEEEIEPEIEEPPPESVKGVRGSRSRLGLDQGRKSALSPGIQRRSGRSSVAGGKASPVPRSDSRASGRNSVQRGGRGVRESEVMETTIDDQKGKIEALNGKVKKLTVDVAKRDKKIEDLKSQIGQISKKSSIRQVTSLQARLEKSERDIQIREQVIEELKRELGRAEKQSKVKLLQQELESAEKKIAGLEQELVAAEENGRELQQNCDVTQNECDNLRSELDSANEMLAASRKSSTRNAMDTVPRSEYDEVKSDLRTLKQNLKAKMRENDNLNLQIRKTENKLRDSEEKIEMLLKAEMEREEEEEKRRKEEKERREKEEGKRREEEEEENERRRKEEEEEEESETHSEDQYSEDKDFESLRKEERSKGLAKKDKDKAKEKPKPKGSAADIDWDAIREKLPMEKTPEHRRLRKQMFNQFDPNGNGYLSLAEVQKGFRDVLVMDDIFDLKPVMMRAFQAAKNIGGKKDKSTGADYVQAFEFRMLLVYVRQYFELYKMFDAVDAADDGRVDLQEFKRAVPLIESWGVDIDDPESAFDEIDENGGGQVLFGEFATWAIEKSLDMDDEDDDDFEDEVEDVQRRVKKEKEEESDEEKEDKKDKAKEKPKPKGSAADIDWDAIREKLPMEKTPEHRRLRKQMFNQFDPNGNGYLSLAEVQKGFRDVLVMDDIFDLKPVMMRAFQAAKNIGGKKDKSTGADYVQAFEFRMLLVYVRQYFELYKMFDAVDAADDGIAKFWREHWHCTGHQKPKLD